MKKQGKIINILKEKIETSNDLKEKLATSLLAKTIYKEPIIQDTLEHMDLLNEIFTDIRPLNNSTKEIISLTFVKTSEKIANKNV